MFYLLGLREPALLRRSGNSPSWPDSSRLGLLTSMSIFAEIRTLVGAQTLHELQPRNTTECCYRTLYLHRDLYQEIVGDHVSDAIAERYAELEADLEQFITSKLLPPSYIYLLKPTSCGVLEIKSLFNPQIRVFGMFICKNKFLATHCERRDNLANNNSWQEYIKSAKSVWYQLFPNHKYLKSNDMSKLFVGATDEKYFK